MVRKTTCIQTVYQKISFNGLPVFGQNIKKITEVHIVERNYEQQKHHGKENYG